MKRRSLREQLVAEFHFSPMEHALFSEIEEDARLDGLLERLFPSENKPER